MFLQDKDEDGHDCLQSQILISFTRKQPTLYQLWETKYIFLHHFCFAVWILVLEAKYV